MADIFNLTDTWNNAGTTFNAIKMNVTNTASGAQSRLLELEVAGVRKLDVRADGLVAAPLGFFSNSDAVGTFGIDSTQIVTSNNGQIGWGAAFGAIDPMLVRDASAVIAQRNSTNPQSFRVYNTYTDASNYERGVFDWSTTPNTLTIGTQKAGTGLARSIKLDNTASHAAAWGTLGNEWVFSSATNTSFQINGAVALTIGSPGLVGYGQITISGATAVAGTRIGGSYYCPTHYGNADAYDDSAQADVYLLPGKVLATATTNITGSHSHVRGGQAASSSAGAANGGNVYLDGGQGYGTGTQGNIIAGSTRGALVVSQHLRRTVPVTKTADFIVANTDNYVICNKGSAGVITLPAASTCPGREISFTNIQAFAWTSASSNVVPRAGGSAGNAILPATDGAWCKLVSDGTNWINLQGTP